MIVFEFDKEDIGYAERISDLAEMSLLIEDPKSFSSDLNTVIQIGVELAPYAITGITLIINRKKIKIKVSDDGITVEGEEEKALEIAKELIAQKKEEEAKKVLHDLLSGKWYIMNIDDMVSKFVEISRAHNQKDDFSENEYNRIKTIYDNCLSSIIKNYL